MANIGTVYKDSYYNKGLKKNVEIIVLDVRTITMRKKFNISVNKIKYPDGKINSNIADGKEDHPDYHIWTNFSNRGESIPSQIVGSIKNAVSEGGLPYKRASLFDPFVQKESIYFTLFSADGDKKIDENHLYNVVAQPYRNMSATSGSYQSNNNAEPNYDENQKTYTKQDGTSIPITTEAIDIPDDDEAPF